MKPCTSGCFAVLQIVVRNYAVMNVRYAPHVNVRRPSVELKWALFEPNTNRSCFSLHEAAATAALRHISPDRDACLAQRRGAHVHPARYVWRGTSFRPFVVIIESTADIHKRHFLRTFELHPCKLHAKYGRISAIAPRIS